MATDLEDGMDLDDLFHEVRALRPRPSEDLMARILADAEAEGRARAAPPPAPVRRQAWGAMFAALGGWPALGTLAASVFLGFGLGVAGPSTALSDLAAALRGEAVSVALGIDEDPLSLLDG